MFLQFILQIAEDKINMTGRREGELCRRLSTVVGYSLEENFIVVSAGLDTRKLAITNNASKAKGLQTKQKRSTKRELFLL